MKRNFLFLILTSIVINLSASPTPKGAQGVSYYKAGFPQVAKPLLLAEYATDTLTRSETCFYLGNIYFGENKPDSAAIYFKKGLIGKQVNVLNTIGLAMLKVKSNPKEAELDIQSVLKLPTSKKNPDYFIAAANVYLFNGMIDQAAVYEEKTRNIKPKYSGLAVLSGDIELARKDVGKACSNYELAILYDDNCKEAYIKYARAYRNVNTQLAIEMLNKLKLKDPSFLLVDKELADIYYTMNDFDNAAKLYDSYLKSGNSNVQDLTKYAMTIFLNKDYTKSLEVAKLGLAKAPRNPAFNRLALYNNVALKNYDEALKYADSFFNKSDNPDISYFDYTYYGQALRNTKQYDLAIIQFKNALRLDSTQVGFWKDISDMYNEKNDYPNAISNYLIYMKSLTEEKTTADVWVNLGKMYFYYGSADGTEASVKKSSLMKADSIFAKVATIDPTSYRGNYYRAKVNFALNPDNGSAKPYYEQTLTLVESKADARYNPIIIECSRFLGYFYFLKEDYTQSKVYWNKILSIEPTNEVAVKAIEGIDKTLKGKKK
jgi:tetratricopeptide (TPR) repeat protein